MESFEVLSLEESCIEAVARDFDNFLVALDRDENNVLKRLLQRKGSDMLFEKAEGPLRKRHASFLINRYLRKLDLNRFSVADIDDVLKILKTQGEGILAVEFSKLVGGPYSKTILIQLALSLPSTLTSLSLFGGEYPGTALQIVTKYCFKLQELTLSCCGVTDAGINDAFSNCAQPINYSLRILDLDWTSITLRGIVSVLNNCPNLTEIHHMDVVHALSYVYRGHLKNGDAQFKRYNLEVLDLDSEELEAARKMCPNVKRLVVNNIRTQRQIDICKGFERLENTTLNCLEPVLLAPFFETRGSALRTVKISGNVTVPVETLIQFCPEIQCLHLHAVKLGPDDRRNLDPARFSWQNLKELSICYVHLASAMRHIHIIFAFAPNIENFVVFMVSGFTLAFVKAIAVHGFPSLTELEICLSEVDAQIMREFINVAPNLKRINICSLEYISQTECENLRLLKNGLRITYTVV